MQISATTPAPLAPAHNFTAALGPLSSIKDTFEQLQAPENQDGDDRGEWEQGMLDGVQDDFATAISDIKSGVSDLKAAAPRQTDLVSQLQADLSDLRTTAKTEATAENGDGDIGVDDSVDTSRIDTTIGHVRAAIALLK